MNLANKYLFNLQQQKSIGVMRKIRNRFEERLNKKADAATPAKSNNNIRNIDMAKLNIDVGNINPVFATALLPYVKKNTNKLVMASTDVNYAEYLAHKGKINEAKRVLNNLKSTLKIIASNVRETEKYLNSLED